MDGSTLCIFKNGDCRLTVAYWGECDTFIVSSTAMSFASPVWKKIMNPPFGEPANLAKKPISFLDDNAEALLILLRIAHLQFREVPFKLDYTNLFNISVLCDKYDCSNIIQPWVGTWLEGIQALAMTSGYEGSLFIAWALGKEIMFEKLAKQLVRDVCVSNTGECLLPGGKSISDPMPPGIIESILSIRHRVVTQLVDITDDYVTHFLENSEAHCQQPKHQRECDALVIGSLILWLRDLNLWPEKDRNTNEMSIRTFSQTLKSLETYRWPASVDVPFALGGYHPSHIGCNFIPQYQAAIHTVLISIPTPVLESHRRHMQIQKNRIGLAKSKE
ncbi:MAG: hypothetical protein M1839_005892 [Geoglossum umbratile]|nr:MAG: hypothetical protein M1839_005892 [Geoglossum umbratile]